MKIKIGDKVTWNGSEGELSCNRYGIVSKIIRNTAFICNSILGDKLRKVPMNRLKKIK